MTALEEQYSQIDQTLGRIDLSVGDLQTKVDDQGTQIESVTGKLSLYVEKTDNGQIVSMLNAAADVIALKSNRLSIDSDYFTLTTDGIITATAGSIGKWDISPDGFAYSFSDAEGIFSTALRAGTGLDGTGIFFTHQGEEDAGSTDQAIIRTVPYVGSVNAFKALELSYFSDNANDTNIGLLIGLLNDIGSTKDGVGVTGHLFVKKDTEIKGTLQADGMNVGTELRRIGGGFGNTGELSAYRDSGHAVGVTYDNTYAVYVDGTSPAIALDGTVIPLMRRSQFDYKTTVNLDNIRAGVYWINGYGSTITGSKPFTSAHYLLISTGDNAETMQIAISTASGHAIKMRFRATSGAWGAWS